MPRPLRRSGATVVASTALLLGASPATVAATPTADAGAGPAFTRIDVDRAVTGASFTTVGEVFPGEQNIITSGYGALDGGAPVGGGTLQVYRPGRDLHTWTKVPVFTSSANIVFPNRVTVADVNGDGRNDLLVPSGWFFETSASARRSTITWWENKGLDASGKPRPFVRHDVTAGQRASFHGVELTDLDGDGIRDLVTTSEAGGSAPVQSDDTVTLQYLKGRANHTFDAPRTLASGSGGSLPVVHDVSGDGRPDIVTSQYFDLEDKAKASFMWFEQVGSVSGHLTEANFTKHTIATMGEAGHGFQIRPVPDLREPGTISWIGANHQNRCFMEMIGRPGLYPAEAVMELTPGADVRAPWTVTVLSTPDAPAADPMDCDDSFKNGATPINPGGEITSRPSPGQSAPGVFGYGDADGDGDTDLVVSGDGDRRLFWIERVDASTTRLHTLTAPGEQFGQSGGAAVADLNGDGTQELVFSSFDTNTVALWTTRPGVKLPPPATQPPAPKPPVVKVATRTKVSAGYVKRSRTAKVSVRVTTTQKKAVAKGRVKVSLVRKGRTVRAYTRTLGPKGYAHVKAPRITKKGRYTVKVTYRGSSRHKVSTGRTTFRVR